MAGLATLMVLSLSAWLVSGGLQNRGGWDLSEQIAAADRFSTPAPLYSGGDTDGFLPSSPYFPGVAGIAFVLKRAFGSDLQEEALLVAASAVAVFYLLLLVQVFRALGGASETPTIILALGLAAYFVARAWLSYAAEFKPDTAGLLPITAAFLIVFGGRASPIRLTWMFALTVIGLVMKQQAAALVIGLFLGIVWSPLTTAEKKRYCGMVIAASVVAAVALLRIDNLKFFAIDAHRNRPLLGVSEVVSIQALIGAQLASVMLIIVAGYQRARKTGRELAERILRGGVLRSYVIMCIPWVLLELRSGIVVGGNGGNTAAAVIPLAPVALLAFESLFGIRVVRGVSVALGAICVALLLARTRQQVAGAARFYRDRSAALAELAPFAGKSAAISGTSYLIARRAGIRASSEIEAVGHIDGGKWKGTAIPRFNERLRRREYDLVLCLPNCGELLRDSAFAFTFTYANSRRFHTRLLRASVLERIPAAR